MGVPGIEKIREHQRMNERIDAWIRDNPVTVHIPVDSPGANFPVCKISREHGLKIVHLVAPQLWAWAPWRVHKLRRLTDLVLCLLPFEEGWFNTQGVPARFIGHPLFESVPSAEELDKRSGSFPTGSPRIALLPGSRPAEIRKNFPLLIGAFRTLKSRHPQLKGVVAATHADVEPVLRDIADAHSGWPVGMSVASGDADAVIHWSDVALVVSGTVTLQIARQRKPMVTFYKSSPILYWGVFRWLLTTKLFSLPNLIAGKRIIPELIPHFGGSEPIAEAADQLLSNPRKVIEQRDELQKVCARFEGIRAGAAAADAIEEVAGIEPTG